MVSNFGHCPSIHYNRLQYCRNTRVTWNASNVVAVAVCSCGSWQSKDYSHKRKRRVKSHRRLAPPWSHFNARPTWESFPLQRQFGRLRGKLERPQTLPRWLIPSPTSTFTTSHWVELPSTALNLNEENDDSHDCHSIDCGFRLTVMSGQFHFKDDLEKLLHPFLICGKLISCYFMMICKYLFRQLCAVSTWLSW